MFITFMIIKEAENRKDTVLYLMHYHNRISKKMGTSEENIISFNVVQNVKLVRKIKIRITILMLTL